MYHVNLQKAWKTQEGQVITPYPPGLKLGPQAVMSPDPASVPMGTDLCQMQQEQMLQLTQVSSIMFLALLGRILLTHHHIRIDPV